MVPLWPPIVVIVALVIELHLVPFIGYMKAPSISHALRGMQARQHSCSLEGLRSASYNISACLLGYMNVQTTEHWEEIAYLSPLMFCNAVEHGGR
jgi:hypothetical protein